MSFQNNAIVYNLQILQNVEKLTLVVCQDEETRDDLILELDLLAASYETVDLVVYCNGNDIEKLTFSKALPSGCVVNYIRFE